MVAGSHCHRRLRVYSAGVRNARSARRRTDRRRRFACPAHSGAGRARRGYADDGITHVTARFGYMETPDVPGALRALDPATTEGQLRTTTRPNYLSKIELPRGKAPTMAPWRKRLLIATSHITTDAAEYFGLPRDRTVIIEV